MIKHRMSELGYSEGDYDLDGLYQSFLKLADKKGQVFDYDLEALTLFNNLSEEDDYFAVEHLSVQSGTDKIATATVSMLCGEQEVTEAAIGNGPINSICQCISRITGYPLEIRDFKVSSTSTGMDAMGQVSVIIESEGRIFHGMGLATDIILSSARAIAHAANEVRRSEQVQQHKLQSADINRAAI